LKIPGKTEEYVYDKDTNLIYLKSDLSQPVGEMLYDESGKKKGVKMYKNKEKSSK
jgi:hypothetical protein